MRGGLGLVASVLALVHLAGCHSHVQLSAPPRSAPSTERLAAYQRLRATGYQQSHVVHVGRYGVTGVTRSVDFLQLASGDRVYYAEDILPVVGPDTPAGIAALESQSARETASVFNTIAVTASIVGSAIMLASVFMILSDSEGALPVLLVGGGIAIVGSILLIPAAAFGADATDEATSAYETYNVSLVENLGLCERGDQVVDCNQPPPAPTPPPASECVPACRSGFMCVSARCVSACNPPCPDGTQCVGQAENAACVPLHPAPDEPASAGGVL